MRNGDEYKVVNGQLQRIKKGTGKKVKLGDPISTCPKCGAPIYSRVTDDRDLPVPEFTCECRNMISLDPIIWPNWIYPTYPTYPYTIPSGIAVDVVGGQSVSSDKLVITSGDYSPYTS